jgi:hypothetical protein
VGEIGGGGCRQKNLKALDGNPAILKVNAQKKHPA